VPGKKDPAKNEEVLNFYAHGKKTGEGDMLVRDVDYIRCKEKTKNHYN
jgi:hypothetical protein